MHSKSKSDLLIKCPGSPAVPVYWPQIRNMNVHETAEAILLVIKRIAKSLFSESLAFVPSDNFANISLQRRLFSEETRVRITDRHEHTL